MLRTVLNIIGSVTTVTASADRQVRGKKHDRVPDPRSNLQGLPWIPRMGLPPGGFRVSLILILSGAGFFPGEGLSAQGAGDFPHGTFPEGVGCMDCHTTEGWKPIQADPAFDHSVSTGFPLVGRHVEASCRTCHEDLHFEKAQASPQECGTCHTDVHGASLSANCSLCHTPTSFQDVSGLRIHQATSFSLEGAHLQISCESCHSDDEGGGFSPLPTDCLACHRDDYEAPKDIDHIALGFPTECLTCHTPQAWMDIGAFDHATFSGGYPLQGAHQQIQCSSCHVSGGGIQFSPSGPQDCVACHQADYQREHAGSGYPQTCMLCHGQGNWDRGDFDHSEVSGGYILAGAHEELACTNCHTPDGTGVLFNPSDQNDCVSCHQGDYQEEHAGTGYPTTCLDCHTPNTWDGATADHSALSDGFGLLGNHGLLPCTSCHIPGGTGSIFNPATPEDCLACHLGDFQREHSGSGYPTTCLTCHQVTTWAGVGFDHDGDYFPINSGKHQGKWTSCQTCHTSPTDYSVFTCFNCHEHNKTDADKDHSEVPGYIYESGQCLSCHPTGSS